MMSFLSKRNKEPVHLHRVGHRAVLLDSNDIKVTTDRALGSGRFGSVCMGEWLGVTVAIKRIVPGLDCDPATKKLLEDQISELLPFTAHPNILPIYGVCELPEGGMWLVLKHGKKGSLSDVLRSGAWRGANAGCPRKLAVHIAKGVCSALAYLHSQSPAIVYRDLKPGNIILSGGMTPLLDPEFGAVRTVLSEIVALRTRSNTSAGSGVRVSDAAYHAPECLTASRPDDWHPPSDVYSLGLLLYDMCTGMPPFANMSEAEVAKALLAKQRPPLPARLHPRIASIIQSCWADDPASRPTARVLLQVFADLEAEFAEDDDVAEYVGPRSSRQQDSRSPATGPMASPPPGAMAAGGGAGRGAGSSPESASGAGAVAADLHQSHRFSSLGAPAVPVAAAAAAATVVDVSDRAEKPAAKGARAGLNRATFTPSHDANQNASLEDGQGSP